MLPERKLVSKYIITTNKKIKPEREWYKIWINGIKTKYSTNRRGNVLNRRTHRTLKPMNTSGNYWCYHLMVNNKRIVVLRHRLIACIFIPIPKKYKDIGFDQEYLEVNHIDRDTTNFETENLEWVTPLENKQHAAATEMCKINKYYINKSKGQGEETEKFRNNSKLTGSQAIEISDAIYRGEKIADIARRYSVTPQTISCIKRGKSWSDVTGRRRKIKP